MVMTDEDDTDCAWCMTHQGIELGNGSHGICETHAEIQYVRYKTGKEPSALNENAEGNKKRSLFNW